MQVNIHEAKTNLSRILAQVEKGEEVIIAKAGKPTPGRLGPEGLKLIENSRNELFLSAASSWELAIKYRLGRIPLPEPPALFIPHWRGISSGGR